MYSLSDFDYDLPPELIAQYPLSHRGQSRLLHVQKTGHSVDRQFADLLELLTPQDVLVLNDTRVMKARLLGEKITGGKIEALVERLEDAHTVLAQVRASKSPKPGTLLIFSGQWEAQVIDRQGDLFRLRFLATEPVLEILDCIGQLPLPPYIERMPEQDDDERYQTVFAREKGAVAAPTAGLHFTRDFLTQLEKKGVRLAYITLHVGAGTFQPVRVENLDEHIMHTEWYHVSSEVCDAIHQAKAAGGRVIAVGTTSLRALESAARNGHLMAGSGETDLFIRPGYAFNVVDALLTNFHLPKSTLLMLVSAFAGYHTIQKAYRHAVASHYRFFSYGDAMLLERTDEAVAATR